MEEAALTVTALITETRSALPLNDCCESRAALMFGGEPAEKAVAVVLLERSRATTIAPGKWRANSSSSALRTGGVAPGSPGRGGTGAGLPGDAARATLIPIVGVEMDGSIVQRSGRRRF